MTTNETMVEQLQVGDFVGVLAGYERHYREVNPLSVALIRDGDGLVVTALLSDGSVRVKGVGVGGILPREYLGLIWRRPD